jgi:hypothetical protein
MKVYVEPPAGLSRAMQRVADALSAFAPSNVKVVPREELADFVVLHVIDHFGVPEVIERLEDRGQRYGIIQYCMRSTRKPNTKDWINIWRDVPVWSYYDLARLCIEDGVQPGTALSQFYHAPLGCDWTKFFPKRLAPRYLVATSGYVAESECVDAVSAAVRAYSFDARQFHLGPDLGLGQHITSKLGISDEELARELNASEFVTGLRRTEGFELPIVEGFFCGCRPITFDTPTYREWFSEMAEFVPEGSAADVTEAVLQIFKAGKRPVEQEEIQRARLTFDWERLVTGFWQVAL